MRILADTNVFVKFLFNGPLPEEHTDTILKKLTGFPSRYFKNVV